MKKKLTLCLCALVMVLGLTACGSEEEPSYGGHSASEYEAMLQNYMVSLEAIEQSDLESYVSYYESSDDEVTLGLLEDWAECYDQKGMFIDYEDFEVVKSGKTITATLTSDYTNRDLKLIFVFNANSVDDGPTAINIEPVYTLGETMAKAGLNTLMGIMIVFCMLIIMSLVISCFTFIPKIEASIKGKNKPEKTVAPVAAPVKAAAPETDDLQLIAVISAAIAASTGASTDSFVVRSIKRRY